RRRSSRSSVLAHCPRSRPAWTGNRTTASARLTSPSTAASRNRTSSTSSTASTRRRRREATAVAGRPAHRRHRPVAHPPHVPPAPALPRRAAAAPGHHETADAVSLYRKKPVVIEAQQLTRENFHAVGEWAGVKECWELTAPLPALLIHTLEGVMKAFL